MTRETACIGLLVLMALGVSSALPAQTKIPDTRIPLNEGKDEPPEFGPHSCLVGFIVSGGKGGHPSLAKGANRLGEPSKAAIGEVADAVKEANGILNQCDVQFHLCALLVIDASKIDDPQGGKKLADTLFDKNGDTITGSKGKGPDPVLKLHAVIEGLPQFKELAAKYKDCAFLFFVKNVSDGKKPDIVTGVGGAVGTKKKPVGIVEGASGSTIAHELVHGLGHDGHTDDAPDPKDPKWKKDAKAQADKSAEDAKKKADEKEKAAQKAEADARAAEMAAADAAQAADDAQKAAEAAKRKLDAAKEAAYQKCPDVKRLRKRIAKKQRVLDDPKATRGQKRSAQKAKERAQRQLEAAKNKCWNKLKGSKKKKRKAASAAARKAEADAAQAEADAKTAADEAADKKKAADDARIAADEASDEAQDAEDARADAENLMDAVPEGTKLEKAQCDLIKQSIKDNLGPCPCD